LGWEFPTKKVIPRKTEKTEHMVISNGIPEQKTLEFHSEPFRERENNSKFRSVEQKLKQTLRILFRILAWKRKQLGSSVPWNKNRSKLSECHSEPFHGRENNLEQNAAAENFKIVSEKTTFEVQTNRFVILAVL
jgi:hypothetical protein